MASFPVDYGLTLGKGKRYAREYGLVINLLYKLLISRNEWWAVPTTRRLIAQGPSKLVRYKCSTLLLITTIVSKYQQTSFWSGVLA